jgi:hypothetical protein
MWEPRRLRNLWACTASYKDSFTFFIGISSRMELTFIQKQEVNIGDEQACIVNEAKGFRGL